MHFPERCNNLTPAAPPAPWPPSHAAFFIQDFRPLCRLFATRRMAMQGCAGSKRKARPAKAKVMQMGMKNMSEPASAAFGGIALYKLGVLGAFAAVLVTIVVMAMTLPKTAREFVVAMISTVVSSIGGGAVFIRWFELQHWANDDIGLVALAAIIFVFGLPAWVMVRGWFVYAELSKHMSLPDMLRELKAVVWK